MKTLEIDPGTQIGDAIKEAFEKALEHNKPCMFTFNDIPVYVAPDSDPKLIRRDWLRAVAGYLGAGAYVGPYPPPVPSPEEVAADAEAEEKNEARRKLFRQNYAAECKAKLVLEGALGNAGPIELANPSLWESRKKTNKDPMGARAVQYAEDWARLMQVRISNGQTVADCREDTERMADHDGITGSMGSYATGLLIACWVHGHELKEQNPL